MRITVKNEHTNTALNFNSRQAHKLWVKGVCMRGVKESHSQNIDFSHLI